MKHTFKFLHFLFDYCLSLLFISDWISFSSYGRVYTADPYHALAPAASYGVGAVVSRCAFFYSLNILLLTFTYRL